MTQAGAEPGPGPEPEPDPNPGPDPEPDPALSRGPPAAGHRAMGRLAVYGYTYYGSGPWAVELTMAMLTMAILTMAAARGRSSSTSCNRSTRDAPRRSTCRGMGQVRPLAVAELGSCASSLRARQLSLPQVLGAVASKAADSTAVDELGAGAQPHWPLGRQAGRGGGAPAEPGRALRPRRHPTRRLRPRRRLHPPQR